MPYFFGKYIFTNSYFLQKYELVLGMKKRSVYLFCAACCCVRRKTGGLSVKRLFDDTAQTVLYDNTFLLV